MVLFCPIYYYVSQRPKLSDISNKHCFFSHVCVGWEWAGFCLSKRACQAGIRHRFPFVFDHPCTTAYLGYVLMAKDRSKGGWVQSWQHISTYYWVTFTNIRWPKQVSGGRDVYSPHSGTGKGVNLCWTIILCHRLLWKLNELIILRCS